MKYNWRTTVDLYSTWPKSFAPLRWLRSPLKFWVCQVEFRALPCKFLSGTTMIHGLGPLEGLNGPSSPVKITLTATRTSTTKKGWKSKAQVFSHSELNIYQSQKVLVHLVGVGHTLHAMNQVCKMSSRHIPQKERSASKLPVKLYLWLQFMKIRLHKSLCLFPHTRQNNGLTETNTNAHATHS